MKIPIIAGGHDQFRDYLRVRELDPRDYFYVRGSTDLWGIRPPKIILTGEYWKNDAANHLEECLPNTQIVRDPY